MTVRAAVFGVLLGLALCASTYFNDWIIGQTSLLGNQLPISIFGVAIAVLLVVNPLLRSIRPSLALHGREVLVAVAISLACFAWPGASFYRWFVKLTALPAHWERT